MLTKKRTNRTTHVRILDINNKYICSAVGTLSLPVINSISNIITGLIIIIFLILGTFFPPILLLNIPLLFLRQAYREYFFRNAANLKLNYQCCTCKHDKLLQCKLINLPVKEKCMHCGSLWTIETL